MQCSKYDFALPFPTCSFPHYSKSLNSGTFFFADPQSSSWEITLANTRYPCAISENKQYSFLAWYVDIKPDNASESTTN